MPQSQKQTNATVQPVFLPPATLLDAVLTETEKRQAQAVVVPAGYQLLPAGVLRQLRVNKGYIVNGTKYGSKPFIVRNPVRKEERNYTDVRVLGESRMACGRVENKVGCGPSHSAWIETTAALLVKE